VGTIEELLGKSALDEYSNHALPQPVRSSVLPPSNWFFEHSSFSISPDGARLAFVAVGPDGNDKLWIRALSSLNAQQVNGTDGALPPFRSPDSRRIGFFAAGKLNTVDLDSGAVRIVGEAPFARCGGAWGRTARLCSHPLSPDCSIAFRRPAERPYQLPAWRAQLPGDKTCGPFFYRTERTFSTRSRTVQWIQQAKTSSLARWMEALLSWLVRGCLKTWPMHPGTCYRAGITAFGRSRSTCAGWK